MVVLESAETSGGRVRIYPPAEQGTGSFDGGKITEIKPIGFSGDGSSVSRVGPLFYWAWASTKGPAKIALHPHRGFEIASYVLEGELGHSDTGGHESRVCKGGVQVMQTGSGISHEEQTFETTEFFQIWFEPNLREAMTQNPTYSEASDSELPATQSDGVHTKSIIGGASPIQLVADVRVEHLSLNSHATHALKTAAGRAQAIVFVTGDFEVHTQVDKHNVSARDFVVVEGIADAKLKAGSMGGEVVVVNVPTAVSYPLLSK